MSGQIRRPYSISALILFSLNSLYSSKLVLTIGSDSYIMNKLHLTVSGCKYFITTNLSMRTSVRDATCFNLVMKYVDTLTHCQRILTLNMLHVQQTFTLLQTWLLTPFFPSELSFCTRKDSYEDFMCRFSWNDGRLVSHLAVHLDERGYAEM